MILLGKQSYLNTIEALFRIYLPLVLISSFYKVILRIPLGPSTEGLVINLIVAAIALFFVLAYCLHNLKQAFTLLANGTYKKIKFISWVALLIGALYLADRLRKLVIEFGNEGLNYYAIYLILFFLLLANNFYKDAQIVLGKTSNKASIKK